jgi:hypothetical protein
MLVLVKRQVMIGMPHLSAPKPVIEHARSGLEYVAIEIFQAFRASPFHDAEEHILDKIINFGLVTDFAPEITRERFTERARCTR